MELTKKQISITKGIAILFMVLLHLFCTREYKGIFTPLLVIKDIPVIYYIALFSDCCVAIYCFCSGYGLMCIYENNLNEYNKRNLKRIFKLYINYWIVLLLFVLIIGNLMGKNIISWDDKKTIITFILNFTAIRTSYNGAWWFLTTYIILVCTSKIINKIIDKYNVVLVILVSFIIYFITYVQRVKGIIHIENPILNWFMTQILLYGTSQFPYIIGAIFAKFRIYTKIHYILNKLKYKNLFCIVLILIMIIAHGIVQSLFVAVFTGIVFIVLFNIMDKPNFVENILYYVSYHSTNIWLTHMFFYLIFFREIVFAPKYPVLIFLWLLILCILVSYVINYINIRINKFLKI